MDFKAQLALERQKRKQQQLQSQPSLPEAPSVPEAPSLSSPIKPKAAARATISREDLAARRRANAGRSEDPVVEIRLPPPRAPRPVMPPLTPEQAAVEAAVEEHDLTLVLGKLQGLLTEGKALLAEVEGGAQPTTPNSAATKTTTSSSSSSSSSSSLATTATTPQGGEGTSFFPRVPRTPQERKAIGERIEELRIECERTFGPKLLLKIYNMLKVADEGVLDDPELANLTPQQQRAIAQVDQLIFHENIFFS